jgi:serine/threonine protein phosphatase 1
MFNRLRQLLRPSDAPSPSLSSIPAGQRVYAVGDIHGRLDLFAALVEAIEGDDAARGRADTTIVLLGDLVDRGPDSAGVIDMARELQARRKVRIIAGNHEEMFLQSLEDADILRHFLRYGGRETALSYAIDETRYRDATLEEAQELLREAVPTEDLEFIAGFENHVAIGDYLFVHAGIRPGAPIEEQKRSDLRWIREPFLSHAGDHGYLIVHGHTITEEIEIRANRIGIDTGAYQSGRLTALGLEGSAQWLIEADDTSGPITTSIRPIQ